MTEQPISKTAQPLKSDSKIPKHVRDDIYNLEQIARMPDNQGMWIDGGDGNKNYYIPRPSDKERALRTVEHLRKQYG